MLVTTTTATVRQNGDENTSTITQNGNGNEAQHFQRNNGDFNVATTDQNASGGFSNIDQDNGNGNYALATQNANSAVNDIEQDGVLNSTTVTQSGVNSTSYAYTGHNTASPLSSGNEITVIQNGARSASLAIVGDYFNGNLSSAGATDNDVNVRQDGADTFSYVFQDGDRNSATVTLNGQGVVKPRQYVFNESGLLAANPAESDVEQVGFDNQATVLQDADGAQAAIIQGFDPVNGGYYLGNSGNVGSITQTISGDNSGAAVYQIGDDNTGTVNQGASDSISTSRQFGVANAALVNQQSGGDLTSDIVQDAGGGFFASGNLADVLQRGSYNSSSLTQSSNGNIAFVRQQGGGVGAGAGAGAQNLSTVNQTGPGSADDDNYTFVSMEGLGNRSTVAQNGTGNHAENTLGAGGYNPNAANNANPANLDGVGATGMTAAPSSAYFTTPTSSRPARSRVTTIPAGSGMSYEGNRSNISQTGSDLAAYYKVADGGVLLNGTPTASAGDRGKGNESFVNQDGRDHISEVWQRGVLELNTVNQSDSASGSVDQNGNTVRTYGSTNPNNQRTNTREGQYGANLYTSRAFASVSTNGDLSTTYVEQDGDNNAEITIGGGENPAAHLYNSVNTAVITQVDAGDGIVSPTPGGNQVDDPFNPFDDDPTQGTPGSVVRQWNDARIVMRGDFGYAQVRQNALNARGTVFQQVGSSNNGASIQQGNGLTGSGITNLFGAGQDSTVNSQQTSNFTAGAGGAATINVEANVTQAGKGNDTYIGQDGVVLVANVTQLGTGGNANGPQFQSGGLRNLVVISQTGAENTATAIQNAGVGASLSTSPASGNPAATNDDPGDDEFYFAGGSRSAEIRILQSNFGNDAYAEQSGLGQRARIEQSGHDNDARIIQTSGATNATAVIRQLGNNNNWQITQTAPGQYQVITQTGNFNSATDIDGAGLNGGSSGSGPIVP